jgi:hypothetical protein
LQYGVQVYDSDGTPLNLLAYLKQQATGLVDREVVLGAAERLRCRLIAIRVPEEIANRRRQQARETAKRKGRTPSEEHLELLGWSLFITNNSVADLTWKAVVVLYRARWQIELLFKLWKSHNQLARSRAGASALEVLAVFYAKLLGVVLQHWILVATAGLRESRSMFKAALALREMVKGLLLCLEDQIRMEEELRQLREVIKNLGKKADRTKDPGYAQLIDDAEFLTWLC